MPIPGDLDAGPGGTVASLSPEHCLARSRTSFQAHHQHSRMNVNSHEILRRTPGEPDDAAASSNQQSTPCPTDRDDVSAPPHRYRLRRAVNQHVPRSSTAFKTLLVPTTSHRSQSGALGDLPKFHVVTEHISQPSIVQLRFWLCSMTCLLPSDVG